MGKLVYRMVSVFNTVMLLFQRMVRHMDGIEEEVMVDQKVISRSGLNKNNGES